MNKEEIFDVVKEVFAGLENAGLIEKHVDIEKNSVLIGNDAVLDSIAFVTLFTDLEDRLSEITGNDVYILVDEVHAFNPEKTFLTVGVLVDYLEHMLAESKN